MRRGRPRKPLELHLIKRTYRRDRHGPLPGTPHNRGASRPEPELSPAEAALRAELENWGDVFRTGYNFFTWDCDIGVDDRDEASFLPAARAAWARLGRLYMETWVPEFPEEHPLPWAWCFFGDPSGPLKSPRKLRR